MLLIKLMLSVCVTVTFSYASLMELNDTTLLSFPPLYSLDDWFHCQRPGDQYCIVDAQLTSNGNDYLMNLLEEYSLQKMKHYNRTLVHRGMCMRGRNQSAWVAAQERVNTSLADFGLQAEVTSVSWCMSSESKPATLSSQLLGGVLVALVVISILATVMQLLEKKSPKICGNRFLRAFSLKQNWEMLTYNKSKPNGDQRMKDLACLDGIRFLGLQMVIFSHVFLIYVYSFVDNPQFVEKMYDKFGWQVVLNSPLWLQNLFTFSGFLQMYYILISAEKKPFTLVHCFLGIINRYIRLTPLAAFALWFTISWYSNLGGGPQWSWLVEREAADCSERWWYHMLYIHNHIPLGKFCMGHTWYLAADMHLYIFGLFLIYILLKYRKAILPVLILCFLASAVTAGLITYFYNLTPLITGQPPEELRLLFRDSKILPLLYVPSWMNLAGFSAGMITAYLLYQDQKNGYKLKDNIIFNVFFHASILFANGIIIAGVVFLASDAPLPRWWSALYAALDRPVLAISFNLLLLGCVTRCKSAFRDLMAWRYFHVLGRLSYSAYIVHFIVLRLLMAVGTQLNHASIASMLSLQVVVTFFTYVSAVPLCLLVEMPPIQLWKAAFGTPQRKHLSDRKKDIHYIDRRRDA